MNEKEIEKLVEQLLNDREQRGYYQQELLNKYQDKTLLVIKANYPTAYKNNHYSAYAVTKIFYQLNELIEVIDYEVTSTSEGLIFYVISPLLANQAKQVAMQLEDSLLGRLIDLDVFDQNKQYSRSDFQIEPRKCFVCNDIAKICSRAQKHDYQQISQYFIDIVIDDIFEKNKFENLVLFALINELNKPHNFGCVGIQSRGSHTDMDKKTFIASIQAISPLFNELELIDTNSFAQLRLLGQKMEKAMFKATKNVNTHKGAIFTLLLVLAGLNNVDEYAKVVKNIQALTKDIYSDFENLQDQSHGQKIYAQTGIKGIREYAYLGYDFLFNDVVEYYDQVNNDTKTYLYIISKLVDTTVIKRSSQKKLEQLQMMARTKDYDTQVISDFCLSNNISCGGSADMLATTILISLIKNNWNLFKKI